MTTETVSAPTRTRTPGAKWRSFLAAFLVIVAFILTPIGIVGYWAKQTLTDTQQYIDTVGPIGEDPATKAALADFITQKINENVDPEKLVTEIFGDLIVMYPRLEMLVPIVSGAIDSVVANAVNGVIQSEQFDKLWRAVNLSAQQAFLKIIEGDSTGPIQLQGDQVVLNVQVILDAVKQALTDRGWGFVANFVPESNATIVILNAPQLAQVQTIYDITAPVMQWLIFGVIALFVLAAVLSRRRQRMVVWIGALLVFWSVLLSIALTIGENVFVNQLAGTPFGPASEVFYTTLFSYLTNSVWSLLLIGIGMIIVGFYLGRTGAARQLRVGTERAAASLASNFPNGPLSGVGLWLHKHGRWIRGVIAGLLFFAILIGGQMTVTRTLLWTLFALVLLIIIEVIEAIPSSRTAAEPDTSISA
jgi:hypothetical protein